MRTGMTMNKNNILRLFILLLVVGSIFSSFPLSAQDSNSKDPILIQAMKDEMDRAMKSLKIENADKPYFIEYSIWDNWKIIIDGTLGSLVNSDNGHSRLLKVDVRVGTNQLDNTAFMSSKGMLSFIGRGESQTPVLEDDYNAIRRILWLNTDSAYKEAVENLAGKKAFLKNQTQNEEIPDFSKEESVQKISPAAQFSYDIPKLEKMVKELSFLFRKYPSINKSSVKLSVLLSNKYYVNSENTVFCQPVPMISLTVTASTQAADGMKLKHYLPIYAAKIEDLPNQQDLTASIQRIAEELTALASAPIVDKYIGPVLFTGQASPELLAQVLVPNLSGSRPSLSDMPQLSAMETPSKLAQRLNLKVLPKELSIVDDPSLIQYQNIPLIGTYAIDDEGVIPKPLKLVENGTLKTLLMSRRPRKEIPNSNGHGRDSLRGKTGVMIGNLIVTAEEGKTYQQLKDELIQLCKSQNMPFGIIIKSLDNPMITGVEFSMGLFSSFSQRGEQKVTEPILIYRVNTADGKEELIRGLSFGELGVTKLKDILSVGNDYNVLNRMMSPSGGLMGGLSIFAMLGGAGSSMGIPGSIVSPSFLFEELELKKVEEGQKKPPILPNPLFSK